MLPLEVRSFCHQDLDPDWDSATTGEFAGCYAQLSQAAGALELVQAEGALELARTGAVLSAGEEEEEPAPDWSVECIVDRSQVRHLGFLPGPASPASLEEFLQKRGFSLRVERLHRSGRLDSAAPCGGFHKSKSGAAAVRS